MNEEVPDQDWLHLRERTKIDAGIRLRDDCLKAWPIGTRIEFSIQQDQRKPSVGTVFDCGLDGVLLVRMFSINRRGNRTVKRVHFKRVLTLCVQQEATP